MRVADVRLGIDEQPWAALPDSTLPGVQVGEQQHPGRPVATARGTAPAPRGQPGVEPCRVGGQLRLGVHHPVVGHDRQRTERVVGRQVDSPDRPEQVSDDDVLLGLGASAQLGPRDGTARAASRCRCAPSGPPPGPAGRCSNAYTSTAPRPPSAASPSASCRASLCCHATFNTTLRPSASVPGATHEQLPPGSNGSPGGPAPRAVSSSTRPGRGDTPPRRPAHVGGGHHVVGPADSPPRAAPASVGAARAAHRPPLLSCQLTHHQPQPRPRRGPRRWGSLPGQVRGLDQVLDRVVDRPGRPSRPRRRSASIIRPCASLRGPCSFQSATPACGS